jgi:membrane protease YdiL (CAAX protease family)
LLISLEKLTESTTSGNGQIAVFEELLGAYPRVVYVIIFCLGLIYLSCGIFFIKKSWQPQNNPSGLLLSLGWAFLFAEGQVLALGLLIGLRKEQTVGLFLAITSFLACLPMIIASAGPNRFRFWNFDAQGFQFRHWKMLGCYSLVGLSLCFMTCTIHEQAVLFFTGSESPPQPTIAFIMSSWNTAPFQTILCIAVAIPIAEEIVFRGFLLEALQKNMNQAVAIGASALAFSLIHLQSDHAIHLFLMGLVLGWVTVRTKSLVVSCLVHGLNNGYALLSLVHNGY